MHKPSSKLMLDIPFLSMVCVRARLCLGVLVEWTVSVLKVLSELSPVLLARGSDTSGRVDGQLGDKRRKMGHEGVEAEEEYVEGRGFGIIAESLLPRSVVFCFAQSENELDCLQ